MPILHRINLFVLHIPPIIEVFQEVIVVFAGHPISHSQINRIEGSVHVSDEPEDGCGERLEVLLLVGVDAHVEGAGVAVGGDLPVEEVTDEGDLGPGDECEGLFVDGAPFPLGVV